MLSRPVLRAAEVAARVVPPAAARPLTRVGGRMYARIGAQQRLIVERNMRRALGTDASDREVARAVDRVFEWYGRYWFDSFRLPYLDPATIDRGFTHEGIEQLAEAIERGRPPIVAMPHLGGWEWAAAWITQVMGAPVTAVAERLEPPEVFDWFLDLRRSMGLHVVPLGPHAAAELSSALSAGHILALLCDRDLSGDGIEVEFFGEPVRLPGGPALLALRSGSPLLTGAVYFQDDGRCHGVVGAPLDTERRGRLREDVTRVTQDLAHELEALIRRAPEQWHLLQPSWPSDYEALDREPVRSTS